MKCGAVAASAQPTDADAAVEVAVRRTAADMGALILPKQTSFAQFWSKLRSKAGTGNKLGKKRGWNDEADVGINRAEVGEDGALFVGGHGENGQLGTGDNADRLAPTRVAGLPAPVWQVAAGACHTGNVTS